MKNYTIDLLLRKLENYKDNTVYACDLAYTLLDEYNIDGSITYNTYEAQEWLKEHYDEMYSFLENYKYNFGIEEVGRLAMDIFNNPEKAMTIIVIETASELMPHLKFIEDNWYNEITLNKQNIEIIKKQLKQLKEEY